MSRLLWGSRSCGRHSRQSSWRLLGPAVQIPDRLAHIITPTGTPGDPMFTLEIDADATNGDGPCNPVDATAEVGGMHKVAVCLTDAPEAADAGSGSLQSLLVQTAQNTCIDERGWRLTV